MVQVQVQRGRCAASWHCTCTKQHRTMPVAYAAYAAHDVLHRLALLLCGPPTSLASLLAGMRSLTAPRLFHARCWDAGLCALLQVQFV